MEIFVRRTLTKINLAFDTRIVPQHIQFTRTLTTGTLLGLTLSGTLYLILTYLLNRSFPATAVGSILAFITTLTLTVTLSNIIRDRVNNRKEQQLDTLQAALYVRYGNTITHRNVADWAAIWLPTTRKTLLITAGINPDEAYTPVTLNLTDDDLAIISALHGRATSIP